MKVISNTLRIDFDTFDDNGSYFNGYRTKTHTVPFLDGELIVEADESDGEDPFMENDFIHDLPGIKFSEVYVKWSKKIEGNRCTIWPEESEQQ